MLHLVVRKETARLQKVDAKSLVLNEEQHHDSLLKNGGIVHAILTSTMNAGERAASRHDRFYLRGKYTVSIAWCYVVDPTVHLNVFT